MNAAWTFTVRGMRRAPQPWNAARIARLRELWAREDLTVSAIADELGTSTGAIKRINRAHNLGLAPRRRAAGALCLPPKHRAIVNRTSLFSATIVDPEESPRLLVDGNQQRKLGPRVEVGRWTGMPFYALTLVERESCPTNCLAWALCYGNHMSMARRHRLTPAIMPLLATELDKLDRRHPGGYVVRLHVLGDFGAPEDEDLAFAYVDFWRDQLIARPALRVFGFTAHLPETPVGAAVQGMTSFTDRCWIRHSGTRRGRYGSVVIREGEAAPPGVVVCPFERGKVKDCGHCGACWKLRRPIGFVEH